MDHCEFIKKGTCSELWGLKKKKRKELGFRRTLKTLEINRKFKNILLSAGNGAVKLALSKASGEYRGGQCAPPPQFPEGTWLLEAS